MSSSTPSQTRRRRPALPRDKQKNLGRLLAPELQETGADRRPSRRARLRLCDDPCHHRQEGADDRFHRARRHLAGNARRRREGPIVRITATTATWCCRDDPARWCSARPSIPALADQIGDDIVTASGTTLLGADNKAGVAEIVTAAEYLIANPEIPHGPIRSRSRPTRRSAAATTTSTSSASAPRTPTRWTARPRRARVRELLGRRDDGHVPRLQHSPRLRQGPDGATRSRSRRTSSTAAEGHRLAGDHRGP